MMSIKHLLTAALVGAAAGNLAYTEVEFKNAYQPNLDVVGGTVSQSCLNLMAAGNYRFMVPVGQEGLFMTYYRWACQGVTLKAKVIQTFDGRQACAVKPNTVQFAPDNKLGTPIYGQTYTMTNFGVVCYDNAVSTVVYKDPVCRGAINPFVFGGIGSTGNGVMYYSNPTRYGRQPITLDFGKCVYTQWLKFTAEEYKLFSA